MRTTFTAAELRFSIEPRRATPHPGDSAEVATAVHLEIAVGATVLTRGRDTEGAFDGIELPLIDIAAWLAQAWAALLYGPPPPAQPHRNDRQPTSFAERWLAQRRPTGSIDAQQRIYDWACRHALEFAATDYVLPNLVAQRIDDTIELSWSAAPSLAPGSDVRFDFNAGRSVVPWSEFLEFGLAILRWVDERGSHIHDDPRLARIRAVLAMGAAELARRAIAVWTAGSPAVAALVPDTEAAGIARDGVGGPISAFLRSSEGKLSADSYRRVVEVFHAHAGPYDDAAVRDIVAGLDLRVAPFAPWESGLRLARLVRRELLRRQRVDDPEAPLDVDAVFAGLRLPVHDVAWTDEPFEGVCLVDGARRAVAIVNRAGQLARTTSGARATLAHELCHVLFDASGDRPVGQVERRGRTSSPIEKRANAFAAELLLPRAVLARVAFRGALTRENLRAVARRYQVGVDLATWQATNSGLRVD